MTVRQRKTHWNYFSSKVSENRTRRMFLRMVVCTVVFRQLFDCLGVFLCRNTSWVVLWVVSSQREGFSNITLKDIATGITYNVSPSLPGLERKTLMKSIQLSLAGTSLALRIWPSKHFAFKFRQTAKFWKRCLATNMSFSPRTFPLHCIPVLL